MKLFIWIGQINWIR